MKNLSNILNVSRTVFCAAAIGLVLCSTITRSFAPPPPPVLLTDGNSTALVDPHSQNGMFNWTVDGQNQLAKQWFWYRIGANPEQSIDTISLPVITTPTANSMTTVYTHPLFTLQVDYLLTGGSLGSGLSDINESISVVNTSGGILNFHFFQYSDFNLGGTAGDDTLQLGTNIFGKYNLADQYDTSVGHFSESAVTPGANHGEAGIVPNIINSLNDGLPTTLADTIGVVGPGDVSWGFQWDVNITSGDTFLLSKLKHIELVPEPSTIALGLLGLAGINWARRRHS